MISRIRNALAVLGVAVATAAAQTTCQSAKRSFTSGDIDLAPLPGYVDICSEDTLVCRTLTAGFPPSVTTMGYFVTADEWRSFQQAPQGFTQYLIAQLAESTSRGDFPGLKQCLRSQQGNIPDHTRLPFLLDSVGRVQLGIFDETDSSISFGIIMKLQPPESAEQLPMVATNTAAVVKGHVLSLYVYRKFETAADVDTAEQWTRTWLSCLRRAN
ncbi:MAG TPA: hypothetical protein VI653_31230 [Steroidobacteraceae bacterium]